MRVLTALLLLAAFVGIKAVVRLPDPSWAIEVKPDPSSRLLLKSNFLSVSDDPVTCNKIFSCADCSHSRVCHPKDDGTLTHLKDIPCPTDRPYCDPDSGTCVVSAPLTCGANDNFICLEKNHFFPDEECHKFHYCDEQYKPKLFTCVEGMVYNAVEQRCDSDDGTCGKFACDGYTLKKRKHTYFPRYYAMCRNDHNADGPLVVGVCPPYYQIDASSQVCEPDCDAHGIGNIPDATDCKKYFTCSETKLPDGKSYILRNEKTCPDGNSFDSSLFICVPDPQGKICPTK